MFNIVTRVLRGTSDIVMVSGQFGAMLLVGGAVAPFAWIAPSTLDFGLLMLLGLVAMVAFLCVNRSLKLAPASVVVPYQYTMIVWAVALGWLVFGDVPDAFTLAAPRSSSRRGSISSGASRSWRGASRPLRSHRDQGSSASEPRAGETRVQVQHVLPVRVRKEQAFAITGEAKLLLNT